MKPRNRLDKFNKQTCDSIKKAGVYFFNDTPAVALRVSKTLKKSVNASYSVIIGYDDQGLEKRQGRYRYICRLGEWTIENIKQHVARHIKEWRLSPAAGSAKAGTVGNLVTEFIKSGAAGYRVKTKGGKLKYKSKTSKNYKRLLETYVLHKTKDEKILNRLTSKVKINGSYNTDQLKDIKLTKLKRDHIKNHHERLAATPIIANRVLSALSTVFTWDANRGGDKLYKGDNNPCYRISKFIENKDKKYLPLEKVLEIIHYIKNNLFRDPHFLAFYMILLEIGERLEDVFGLAWKEPYTETEKLKCSGWLILDKKGVYLRDSKDRQSAFVPLTDDGLWVLQKLQELKSNSWSAGSRYVFPRASDITKHISNSSYKKKLEKFNYKFGLAERTLVSTYGKRKRYKYKNIYTLKHLRKSFATHFNKTHGLQKTSERMRHSSPVVTKEHYVTFDPENVRVSSVYDVGSNVLPLNKKEGSND